MYTAVLGNEEYLEHPSVRALSSLQHLRKLALFDGNYTDLCELSLLTSLSLGNAEAF